MNEHEMSQIAVLWCLQKKILKQKKNATHT